MNDNHNVMSNVLQMNNDVFRHVDNESYYEISKLIIMIMYGKGFAKIHYTK